MIQYAAHDLQKLRRDVRNALSTLTLLLRRIDREIYSIVPPPSAVISEPEQAKVEIIKQKCAEFFRVPFERISTHDKRGRIACARHCAMTLAYDHTRLSLQEVGDAFSGFDHGTVIYARSAIFDRIDVDELFKADFEKLRRECLAAIKPKDHAA